MMDLNLIWKAILIILFTILLIRLSGRRSVSQMTISQTVIMISIGTLLFQPIASKSIWVTFILAITFIILLNVIEYVQMKWDITEVFFTGRSKIIIENGQLIENNLSKLQLSVDKLDMRLRQNGIENIADVKWATLEKLIMQLNQNIDLKQQEYSSADSSIFSEIKYGHKKTPNDHLK